MALYNIQFLKKEHAFTCPTPADTGKSFEEGTVSLSILLHLTPGGVQGSSSVVGLVVKGLISA